MGLTPLPGIDVLYEWQIKFAEFATECPLQVDRRHPPGLADRLFAARERNIIEMGSAYKVSAIGDKELAAPDAAVGSIPGAIKRHPDHVSLMNMINPCAWQITRSSTRLEIRLR